MEFVDKLEEILPPLVFESYLRAYHRDCEVNPNPMSFEFFVCRVSIGGLASYNVYLEPLEKALGIT